MPVEYDIEIYMGDDFELAFFIRNDDNTYPNLTGYTGLAQLRTTPGAASPTASFTVTMMNQSVAPGGVLVTMADTITSTLTPGDQKYDVELTDTGGLKKTYIKGDATIVQDVSRP